jgi:hypothetical protein
VRGQWIFLVYGIYEMEETYLKRMKSHEMMMPSFGSLLVSAVSMALWTFEIPCSGFGRQSWTALQHGLGTTGHFSHATV